MLGEIEVLGHVNAGNTQTNSSVIENSENKRNIRQPKDSFIFYSNESLHAVIFFPFLYSRICSSGKFAAAVTMGEMFLNLLVCTELILLVSVSMHKQGRSLMLEQQFFFGAREWKMTDITCEL